MDDLGGKPPLFLETSKNTYVFGIHTKKRQTALNQDAGLEYDLFTWNSAISTLEKRRRWQVRTVIHASQKKKA